MESFQYFSFLGSSLSYYRIAGIYTHTFPRAKFAHLTVMRWVPDPFPHFHKLLCARLWSVCIIPLPSVFVLYTRSPSITPEQIATSLGVLYVCLLNFIPYLPSALGNKSVTRQYIAVKWQSQNKFWIVTLFKDSWSFRLKKGDSRKPILRSIQESFQPDSIHP